jgi:DNA adenine methylase
MSDIEPLIKWAGGKRWFVKNHSHLFPEKFDRYVEPFFGSGAVFFHLKPQRAILSDTCRELMQTYEALRRDWKKVYKYLKTHHENHSHNYYYAVREQELPGIYQRAARLIYLNRTCWNGLYRVNLNGEFNVPIGTKTRVLTNSDNFEGISRLLANVELKTMDFESVIESAAENDFIFVDPPYTVLHNENGFTKYNQRLFSWHDQLRLHAALIRAVRRGARVLVTNADHFSIRELYSHDFNIQKVARQSVIASKSIYRKKCWELVIRSYS